jgi:hypothetical protein
MNDTIEEIKRKIISKYDHEAQEKDNDDWLRRHGKGSGITRVALFHRPESQRSAVDMQKRRFLRIRRFRDRLQLWAYDRTSV